jgi:hypothetical protein
MPESRVRKVTRCFKEHARVTSAGRNRVEVGLKSSVIITNPEGFDIRLVTEICFVNLMSWLLSSNDSDIFLN